MSTSHPLPDDLDRRIDAALRRRFEPPRDLEAFAPRLRERLRPRASRWVRPLAVLAAAAALVLFLLARERDTDPAPRHAGSRGAQRLLPQVERDHVAHRPAPEEGFCRLIGPLVDGQPEPGRVHSPDLARIYFDMDSCQRGSSESACWTGDLADRLSETYGQAVELRPEAAGVLHGPFGSSEWPTATIMTSTMADVTSVLVADLDTNLACCVQPFLDEGSGLHCFTWPVGDLVFAEITPAQEPNLLSYFE